MQVARFILAAILSLSSHVVSAQPIELPVAKPSESTKLDAFGDPLPPGALVRFGTIRLRHDAKAVAFLDDKTIVSVGSSIRFWDAATGRLLRTHRHGKMTDAKAAAISGDAKRAITLSWDRSVRVWNIASGELVREFRKPNATGESEPDASISASADGSRFITVELDSAGRDWQPLITVFSLNSKSAPFALERRDIQEAVMSQDGKFIATAVNPRPDAPNKKSELTFWDSDSGKRIRTDELEIGFVFDLKSSQDGKAVAAVGQMRTVLQTINGETLWRRATECNNAYVVGLTSNRLVLAVRTEADESETQVIDAGSGEKLRRWLLPPDHVPKGAISPDGTKVVMVIGNRLYIYNLADGNEVVSVPGPTESTYEIRVAPNGCFMASISWGAPEVLLWDAATGEISRRLDGHRGSCRSIAFSPDGKLLAASSYSPGTIVWDVATGRQSFKLTDELDICMSFLPDNQRLAHCRWSAGGGVRVHDCASGKLVNELPPPFSLINCEELGFGPNGRLLAVYSSVTINRAGNFETTGIDIWDVVSGGAVHHFDRCPSDAYRAAWTRDGRTFAARFDNGDIKLWEMWSGQLRWTAKQPDAAEKRPWIACRFALSPDGQALAAIGQNRSSVDLWDLASGKLFGSIAGYDQPIETLEFSPDGRRLFTAYADATMLAWDMTRPEWRARPLNHPLTDEEVKRHWDRLRHSDADEAYRSKWALVGDPKKTIAFLSTHIASEPRIAPERVKALIADLDSAEYAVRERAQRELQEHFRRSEALLRKTLEGPASTEVKNRINRMIAAYFAANPPPDQLRDLRAIEVLEQIGTPEARDLLRRLGSGEVPTRVSRDAAESLKRLESRPR